MIYAFEVQEALTHLEEVGMDTIKDDYVLYAGKFAEFSSDLFPLPVIVVDDEYIPNEVAYIAKRDPRLEMLTVEARQIDIGGDVMEPLIEEDDFARADNDGNTPLMTGKEWFNEFEKHYHCHLLDKSLVDARTIALRAAKKAAGILDE